MLDHIMEKQRLRSQTGWLFICGTLEGVFFAYERAGETASSRAKRGG